jgi:hypothetical protein
VVAALLHRQAAGDGGDLEQVAFLLDLNLLGGNHLGLIAEGLPARPPGSA